MPRAGIKLDPLIRRPALNPFSYRGFYFDRDGQPDHRHSANVWFHEVGIGDHNDDDINSKRKIRTLGTIRRAFGDDEVSCVKILKILTPKIFTLTELQIRGDMEDTSKIIFLISQWKHIL